MKYLILLSVAVCINVCGYSQAFFKPIPKVPARVPGRFRALAVLPTQDSILNAFRPITNIAAYAEPGNILMAGAGLSYQHLRWNATTTKWDCQWSVSAMGWAGGSVAPKTPADAISYGIMFGFMNNLIMVGPAFNGNKLQAVLSLGITLNN